MNLWPLEGGHLAVDLKVKRSSRIEGGGWTLVQKLMERGERKAIMSQRRRRACQRVESKVAQATGITLGPSRIVT